MNPNPNDVVLISSSSDEEEEEEDDVILISSDEDEDDDCSESDDDNQQDYDVIELMDSDDDHDKPLDHVPRGTHDNQGGNNSNELSTFEIKSYLRKHGMRLSGTKEECMERIKEHERLKDGGGESLYPISSFSINCTGDACRNDVVLFRQNVRKGIKIVGTRIVAGRIVTESYGASCQQHTFTVEVLWSKRYKKLDPLSILLVKGRYLYKYGTKRQPWENEAERLLVLEEKHSRGDAARLKRKLRQTGFASSNDRGRKCRKLSDKGQCKSKKPTRIDKQKSQPTQIDKQTSSKRKGKAHVKESTSANKKKVVPALFQKMKFKGSTRLPFCPDSNLNPTRQEASSSFPCDTTLVPYGHHNNGQREANHVSNQPPGYHHHNYQQPIPRYKSKYPISSFSIDCTGDACEGDVVLFKQGVYKQRKVPWKQGTIVGRIVKDVYLAPKRRHDFTIEVLWTKGALHLNPFSVVVVKDWNVYRFGTLRQPWENEAERSEVLKEKHRRAEAANKYKRKLWKTDITSSNNAGLKRQKLSREGPSQNIQPTQKDKHKSSRERAAALVKKSIQAHKRKAVRFEKTELKTSTDLNPNLNTNPDSKLQPKANLNVNPNSNLNPNPNINSTPTPKLNPKPSSNSKQRQKPKPNPTQKPKPNLKKPKSNLNPSINLTPTPNLNPKPDSNSNLNLNQMQNPKPNLTQKPKPNPKQPNSNLNPNINSTPTPNLNPKPNSNSNLNQMQKPKPNPTQKPKSNPKQKPNSNLNPNAMQKPKPKQKREPKLNPTSNPNPYMNSNLLPYPYPYPNSNIYYDHHQQEASSSIHHDRTLLPNFPTHGFPPNLSPLGLLLSQSIFGLMPHQLPHGFNHDLPPYEFSGFGGQWGPSFYQPPDYYHHSW